jgi:hypothetical protein
MTVQTIPLTDTRGKILLAGTALAEPLPGSVLLTNGEHGTAWQRFFSDGKWHPTRGGGSRTWEQMLTMRNAVLVYDAPVRERDFR